MRADSHFSNPIILDSPSHESQCTETGSTNLMIGLIKTQSSINPVLCKLKTDSNSTKISRGSLAGIAFKRLNKIAKFSQTYNLGTCSL